MRAGDAARKAEALRLESQRLDMARQRIVALVAMQVDHQPAFGRDLAERAHRTGAVLHGALEMRNAAHNIDAHVEGTQQVLLRIRRTVETVLGEGDKLQVEIGRHHFPNLKQRLNTGQPVVADIDMGANREQALADREVAIGKRPPDHRLRGEQRLQLAPQGDALQQRAALVHARQTEGQRRIHVEMAVDERRRNQTAGRIDHAAGLRRYAGFERDDPAALAGDVDVLAPVGQGRVLDEKVEGHGGFPEIGAP